MKKSLAIVTMVFNEGVQLSRWIRHYSKHIESLSDIYIINHGSNDGSIEKLPFGVNVINLDRNEGNGLQTWRASYVSNFVNELQKLYRAVVYVDCDEYLVVDPRVAQNLFNYVNIKNSISTHTIGFDVLHDRACEPSLGDSLISRVRKKIQFVAAMCKPVIALDFTPIKWQSGFHVSNINPVYGDLYLFHARYADVNHGLKRLSITRELYRPETASCPVDHQKINDDMYLNWVDSWIKFQTSVEDILDINSFPRRCVDDFCYKISSGGVYEFNYSYRSTVLYLIPDIFLDLF